MWEPLRWRHALYSKIQQSFIFKYLVEKWQSISSNFKDIFQMFI